MPVVTCGQGQGLSATIFSLFWSMVYDATNDGYARLYGYVFLPLVYFSGFL